MRTDSDRNLSAEADPNPARKTRERVLTTNGILNLIEINDGEVGVNLPRHFFTVILMLY